MAEKEGPSGELEKKQSRFTEFIKSENERLDRLIRNLYLYLLQFKHYSERDLYDRICQEVAEYFRAASCELYIVRYEEQEKGHLMLTRWLELVGASGPGRRALRQQYIRQRIRNRYELPIIPQDNTANISGMTYEGFYKGPKRYASGYDWRQARKNSSEKEFRRDAPRQVIWYQDGLYNSCRCSMMAPLVRESKDTSSGSKIGLIKIENRSPYSVAGFSDVPSEGANQNPLFFPEEWKIAALRPYIRDLKDSVKKENSVEKENSAEEKNSAEEAGDPFRPLTNNIGWQQYFEDHPLGAHYFQELLQELRQLKQNDEPDVRKELRKKYEAFAGWLEDLVECLIRLESWLQHLRYACRLMYSVGEEPSLDEPTPSLFNTYNLRAAYLESRNSEKQKSGVYPVVRKALLDCLAKDTEDKQKLQDEQDLKVESLIALRKQEKSLTDPEDKRIQAEQTQAEHKIESCIQDFCKKHVDAFRKILGIADHPFKIDECLSSDPGLPDWKFKEALSKVVMDIESIIKSISKKLEPQNLIERDAEDELISDAEYELISEEAEVRQICKVVRSTLHESVKKQKQYGAACALNNTHKDEPAATGCKAARALAAATMYADSFHQIDEKRLVFIASHVAQVLDNHLLHQAHQRRLDIDYGALDILGLEPLGLELLDILDSCAERITHVLRYLLEREAYRAGEDSVQTESELHPLKTLVKKIPEFLEDATQKNKKWLPHCLATVTCSVKQMNASALGATVLCKIDQQARKSGLSMKPDQATKRRLRRVTFLPDKILIPKRKVSLAEGVLSLTKAKGEEANKSTRIDLFIHLRPTALRKRDLRALWSAVKVLEDIMKAAETTARGIPDVATSTGEAT